MPIPEIPAWALDAEAAEHNRVQTDWPHHVTRERAWGGSDGTGVRVCIVTRVLALAELLS